MSDPVLITLIIGLVLVAIVAISAFSPRKPTPTDRYAIKTDLNTSMPMWTSEIKYGPDIDKNDTT